MGHCPYVRRKNERLAKIARRTKRIPNQAEVNETLQLSKLTGRALLEKEPSDSAFKDLCLHVLLYGNFDPDDPLQSLTRSTQLHVQPSQQFPIAERKLLADRVTKTVRAATDIKDPSVLTITATEGCIQAARIIREATEVVLNNLSPRPHVEIHA